jgi:signal transduction histidine kinase
MHEAAPAGRLAPAPPAAPASLPLASRIQPAHLARAAAAAAGAIGLAVLLGWALDLSALKSVLPGFVAMQPWTATGFVFGGLALWLAASPRRGARVASAASALALAAVAGAPLIEQATGLDLGTDLLLFPEAVLSSQTRPYGKPGRITVTTAQGLVAVAVALLLVPRVRGRPERAAFSLLATAALATAAVSLLGYALGLEPLDAMFLGQTPALHTALALGALAVGTLALRPDVGWVRSVAELGRVGWAAAGLLGAAALLLTYGAQATLRAGVEAHAAARSALRLEALLSTLKDAETGQRGYLLTGDEDYLQPYWAARTRLPAELAAMDVELFGASSAGLARIRALTDTKMAELAETIALRRSGDMAGALAVVETGRGKAIMEEIRATAEALTNATAAAAATARAQELRAAMLAGLGGLGLVGLAFWAVATAAQARRAAAERAAAAARALGAAEAEARESERRFREIEMELAHANRVATMGQLTASIAHEVKQPVAATVTNAQAALRWLGGRCPDLEEVRQALARIVRDGNRAGDVIDRIRALIKKVPPRNDRLEINEAIREVIELTRGEAVKSGVSVQTELADGLPLIQGDRVQLQQVILNLIINAIEAMSGVSEGARDLLISTEKAASGGVLVAVRDSGPGLDPAKLERLFEAFYTTKPGGLGMGLSICRSITEAHGGRLWANANTPRGAIFQIALPRDGMDAQLAQPSPLVAPTASRGPSIP